MSNFGDSHDQPVDLAGRPDSAATTSGGRRRTTGRRIAAVATGTTIALGAGGIAWAATGTPTPTLSSPSAPADPYTSPGTPGETPAPDGESLSGGHFGGHGPGGMPFIGGALGGVPLHGEQVVETSDGVYATIATQRGTVNTVTATSLTVTSEDGFSRTYVLTADSLVDERTDEAVELAVGDEVMVVATVDGTTATVTRAIDLDALPATTDGRPFEHGGPGGRGPSGRGPDGSFGEPAPNETPSETPGGTASPAPSSTIEGSSA